MHAFQATQKSFRYVILTACWSCAAYTLSSVTLLHNVCRHDAGAADGARALAPSQPRVYAAGVEGMQAGQAAQPGLPLGPRRQVA